MAAGRIVLPGWMPALDSNGAPIPNAQIYIYLNGTTTLATVYSDDTLTTPIANPVEANSSGQFPEIWADDSNLFSISVDAPFGPPGIPFTFDSIGPATVSAVIEVATDAARAIIGYVFPNVAPVPTGVPAVDTPIFQAWLNTPSNFSHVVPAGLRTLRAITIPSNIRLQLETGARFRHDPADEAINFISATGRKNIQIDGVLEVDGAAAARTTFNNCVEFSGCGNVKASIKAYNAKAVGGSYGNCFNFINGTDYADGTRSEFTLDINGGGFGTYGGQLINSLSVTIDDLKATGCPANAGFGIHNFDLPVPSNPTQAYIKVGAYETWGNGIGLEVFGIRSGVGINGDINARQSTNGFIQIGDGISYDNSIHSVAFQGGGMNIGLISSKGNGTGFNNRGGPLLNLFDSVCAGGTSEGDGYFGWDLGLSTRTQFGPLLAKGFGFSNAGIAFNLGATVECVFASLIAKDMPTSGIGVRMARWDGAGASNQAEWSGTGTVINSGVIDITNVSQTGIQMADGYDFARLTLNCVMYAAGTPADLKGVGFGCDVSGIHVYDPAGSTYSTSVAAATSLIVPDYASDVVVTGSGVNVQTILFAGDEYFRGRPRFCRALSFGSGYDAANTTVTFTTDGTPINGAFPAVTGFPVLTGDGKIVGAVMDVSNCNKNATTCTATINTTSGSGGNLVVTLGGRFLAGRRRLDFFPTGAITFKDGAFGVNELAIGADRLASAFNLSHFAVQSDTTFWKQVAWNFNN